MITLKDLAEKLDISVSSVSKALNNSSEISEDTIKRVKELAKLYNYTPNKIAQSLKRNATNTIGVIVPSILNRFFAQVVSSIEQEARKNGYHIITCISDESLQKEQECVQLLSNGSVDGFIIAVAEETQKATLYNHFQSLKHAKIPLVMFDRVIENFPCDKVIIDDFETSKNITEKLLTKQKKQIAFISTIHDLNVGKYRYNGYCAALKPSIKPLLLSIATTKTIQNQIRDFLKENPAIDAIFAADNVSGTVAISVANNLGLSIPENLAIVGFADAEISNLSLPKLAFISQNPDKIGKEAFQLMLQSLKNKNQETTKYTTKKVPISFLPQDSF